MSLLWNRDFGMTIGTQKINIQNPDLITDSIRTSLKVQFNIERNDNRDPNEAEIQIYNLGLSNRKLLQQGAELLTRSEKSNPRLDYDWPLVVKGGYVGNTDQIFTGNITRVDSAKEGVDWVTSIEAKDGAKEYQAARISRSFGPGTTVQIVLTAVATAMGIGLGNSAITYAGSTFRKGFLNFKTGVSVVGQCSAILDKYITGAGFTWSIQDGQLQVLGKNQVLLDSVVVLSAKKGLVGSPEVGEKGIVSARCLLQGKIRPGRLIRLTSDTATGEFRVTRAVHSGDTWGSDWYTEWEGVPI